MEIVKKVFTQTSWQVFGKITTSLSTLIILGLISRKFHEEGVGIYTLALTYLAFFYVFSDFGFNAYVLPKLLQEKISLEWQKLFGLRLILSIFLTILATAALYFWPYSSVLFKQSVVFGVIAIIASATFVTCNALFQSKFKYDLSFKATFFGTIFSLLITIFVLTSDLPIPYLVLGHLAGWIAIAATAIFFVSKFINVKPVFDLAYIKETVYKSLPISLTLVLNVVYFRADSFILSFLKSFTDVGVYNLSYSVFQGVLVLPTFIMNSFYPIMLKEYEESLNGFKKQLIKAGLFMLGISVLGILITFIFSDFFIGILTGRNGFIGSNISLKILSLSFPAYFLSSVLMWAIITMKKFKALVIIYFCGLLVNILLNVVFIPSYSYFASSWITGISEYLILILQIAILYRQLGVRHQ